MSRIRKLSPVVADRIAAGEVVERPASVVKELVENALDAGARRIRIAVDSGGIDGMRVEDDGEGMSREDLALSVERHATSKLTRLEDLDTLATLGFRGEALAAIAAVSRLRIETRTAEAPHGWALSVYNGAAGGEEPVGRARGTSVHCTDLFLTLPARHKTLATPAAERGHVVQTVAQLAAAHPDVSMELITDGEVVWSTPGDGDLRHAVGAVWGEELAARAFEVGAEALGGAIRVTGLAAPPEDARGNRQGQVVSVNGRTVRNFALRAAAEQAYGELVGSRRHPLFWLLLTIPTPDVDPNAHPAKAEVRIMRERAAAGVVFRAVADALTTAPTFPLRTGEPASARTEAAELPLSWDDRPPVGADEAPPPLHREIQQLIPLGQWAARYILAQGPDGLYLIDQHAAHERVYYDQLVGRAERPATLAQPLLMPIPLTLSAREWAMWQEQREWLERAGFEMSELGGTTVAVRAVPAFLGRDADLSLLMTVIESLATDDGAVRHPVSWILDHTLATAACKAAVKASKGLSVLEMQELVTAMSRSPSPRSCPHGRPTLLVLGLEEVDRRFGR